MPFSLTNNAIGRNALGQGKFNTNSSHRKWCLHMDESHCNAAPSSTLCPWRISIKRNDFCFCQEEQITCTVEPWLSSVSQLFSAVIQSRAGEAQEDLKDEEKLAQVCFQAQRWHSPISNFIRMLLMQGRAEHPYHCQIRTCLAWQPGRPTSYLAIKAMSEEGSWGPALFWWVQTVCTTQRMRYMNLDQYCLHNLPTHKPRTSNSASIWTLHNYAWWVLDANVQVFPEPAQRPTQTQQVRMWWLGLVSWK